MSSCIWSSWIRHSRESGNQSLDIFRRGLVSPLLSTMDMRYKLKVNRCIVERFSPVRSNSYFGSLEGTHMNSPGWSGTFAAEPGAGLPSGPTRKGSNRKRAVCEFPTMVQPLFGVGSEMRCHHGFRYAQPMAIQIGPLRGRLERPIFRFPRKRESSKFRRNPWIPTPAYYPPG